MLELRPNCECCDRDIAPQSRNAFECTWCEDCATNVLHGTCPNCQGELVRRPVRPDAALARHPASTERILSENSECVSSRIAA